MANDQIKKADNGTYYFRANLGFDHSTGKRIQKYRSGFKTKKEAKEEYAKLVLQFDSQSLPTEQKRIPFGTFIEDTYLPWYQTQVKESTFENRAGTAFDRAVILGITERNPSRMVGNVRGQKPLVDFWTLDEFEKVISKLYKGDYYEHYLFISLLFLFMSGMRLGPPVERYRLHDRALFHHQNALLPQPVGLQVHETEDACGNPLHLSG